MISVLTQEVECFSSVSALKAVELRFFHVGDLFIEFQLVVNGDTKESEAFITNWYRCIITKELWFRSF